MQLVRNWHAEPSSVTTVAIGNFDGVHLGHQALLAQCSELADEQAFGVVSFAPLPVEVLFPQRAQGRVTSTRQRIEELQAQGVDVLWLLRFNLALARQTPSAFIQRVLVDGLKVKHVVVGEDFRFGHQRAGDIDTLRAAGEHNGFTVHAQQAVTDTQDRISSSRIRAALKSGDVSDAAQMLGRDYAISGKVISGQRLGRKLGFPTINIDVSHWQCLLTGVFAVQVSLEPLELSHKTTHNRPLVNQLDGPRYNGVASIGYRPSVNDVVSHNRHLLEVHIFDWSGDLYGQRVKVHFIQHLRDEQQFADLGVMTRQMQTDADQARLILALINPDQN